MNRIDEVYRMIAAERKQRRRKTLVAWAWTIAGFVAVFVVYLILGAP